MRRIVLASASPRRRELLAQTGLNFEVIPGEVDEEAVMSRVSVSADKDEVRSCVSASTDEDTVLSRAGALADEDAILRCTSGKEEDKKDFPARVVEALSASKAEATAEQVADGIVIGSDTIVWDGKILGKPADRQAAREMLRGLQGRTHSVFTGVTVLVKDGTGVKRHTFSCETKVDVYPMTEEETESYLDTGEYSDKAGAYGIQGRFGLWVRAIEGDYNSVVGLPLSALWQVLKQYIPG